MALTISSCVRYKGYVIKEFFANYFMHMSDVTFHVAENCMEVHRQTAEPWRVTLVDTGDVTQTGGRIKRVMDYVKREPYFARLRSAIGDGVADIDIAAEVNFHKTHGRKATVTAVRPARRLAQSSSMAIARRSFGEAGLMMVVGLMVAFLFSRRRLVT